MTTICALKDENDTYEVVALPSGEFQARVVLAMPEGELIDLGTYGTTGEAITAAMFAFTCDNEHLFENDHEEITACVGRAHELACVTE